MNNPQDEIQRVSEQAVPEVTRLRAENAALKAENAELKYRLNQQGFHVECAAPPWVCPLCSGSNGPTAKQCQHCRPPMMITCGTAAS